MIIHNLLYNQWYYCLTRYPPRYTDPARGFILSIFRTCYFFKYSLLIGLYVSHFYGYVPTHKTLKIILLFIKYRMSLFLTL